MQFQRRLKRTSKPDLIPMIDVVFQLVIFFMLSSTFIRTPGIPLELPDSSSAETVVMTSMVITMQDEETVYLNETEYTLEGLWEVLSNQSDDDRAEIDQVIVEADRGVPYGRIINLLDTLRLNGYTGVGLRTSGNTR